jgi:hypothetical protein
MDGIYNNTGYRNTRNRKQILILDVDDSVTDATHLGGGGEFNVPLLEPLIIDKQSEVYLDNFVTFNSNISHISANTAFVLKINEFNINSKVASSRNNDQIYNSIIIPNEHSSVTENNSAVLHKAKKFNYVCDVNPGKISSITGKITNLYGGSMFHGNNPSHIYSYILTGIDPGNYSEGAFPITAGEEFTSLTNMKGVDADTINGEFLAHHENTTPAIYFSTNTELSNIKEISDPIVFTISAARILTIDAADPTNLHLHPAGHGRFIAEFSINSRE